MRPLRYMKPANHLFQTAAHAALRGSVTHSEESSIYPFLKTWVIDAHDWPVWLWLTGEIQLGICSTCICSLCFWPWMAVVSLGFDFAISCHYGECFPVAPFGETQYMTSGNAGEWLSSCMQNRKWALSPETIQQLCEFTWVLKRCRYKKCHLIKDGGNERCLMLDASFCFAL